MKPKPVPTGLLCLWAWSDEAARGGGPCPWRLVEVVPTGDDGYPAGGGGAVRSADAARAWVCDGPDPRPGRLVTGWSLSGGVVLVDFRPPGPYPDWLDDFAGEALRASREWTRVVRGGSAVADATEREARRALAAAR